MMNFLRMQGLVVSVVFLAFACNINPELAEEDSRSTSSTRTDKSLSASLGPVSSFPISLNRVDLFTMTSSMLTGAVTVQITNGDGTVVIGSTTVAASSLAKNSNWNTFAFSPMTLSSGVKYRINVKRSSPHNPSSDYIYWRSTHGDVDVYPQGVSDVHFNKPFDYSFVTYSDGHIDQQQTIHPYGFSISGSDTWQEFVPEKILVNLPD